MQFQAKNSESFGHKPELSELVRLGLLFLNAKT